MLIKLSRFAVALLLISLLALFGGLDAHASNGNTLEDNRMMVEGTFEVNLEPQVQDDIDSGRMIIEKRYLGPLLATGKGQMLSYRSSTEGTAGYVALEIIEGELDGRTGSFVIQHYGMMNKGTPSLMVEVIPDSGQGALQGIQGSMHIDIKDGQHFYRLEYSLPN